jgi:hypothetical protein
LQTFETSLVSLGLGRYHTALVLTVSAAESALRAFLEKPLPTSDSPKGKDSTLPGLIKEARVKGAVLSDFTPELIEQLKKKRNRMTHFGHSPADNGACAELLLDIAYPLLSAILQECFVFDLAGGFVPSLASQWARMFELRTKTKAPGIAVENCFVGLGHFIRHTLSPTFLTNCEMTMSGRAWENGSEFEFLQKRLVALERQFSNYWITDCPCCDDVQCLALDLLFQKRGFEVGVRRAMCVHCDWVVPECGPVASILLANQVAEVLPEIIKGFGLEE